MIFPISITLLRFPKALGLLSVASRGLGMKSIQGTSPLYRFDLPDTRHSSIVVGGLVT